MKIHRNQVPDHGLNLEGEIVENILLPGEGLLRQAGPLRYQLECGANSSGFWASGTISLLAELECVRCLRPFNKEILVPDFAIQIAWEVGDLVDLTPLFREDILLVLPTYPDCHRDGDLECPGFGTSVVRDVAQGKKGRPGISGSAVSPWDRLDSLDLKNRKA